MTKPKFYRDGAEYVVRDCWAVRWGYKADQATRAAAKFKAEQETWRNRFRVYLVEDGKGVLALGYGADPRRVAARLKGLIVAVGPLETEWHARMRRARIETAGAEALRTVGCCRADLQRFELTPRFRDVIVNESVGLYGPVTREIRARRRRALARTTA